MLVELHSELEQTNNVDEGVGELLRNVKDDIHQLLDDSQTGSREQHNTLSLKLHKMVEHFAESHPTLASNIGRVIDTLSGIGI